MKVLVVTTSYPGRRTPHNGVFVRDQCRALRDDGLEVVVLAPRVFREDPALIDDDGIAVHRFPFWSGQRLLAEYGTVPVARMATYLASGALAGARLARSTRPDVVHGHWAIPAGPIAAAAARAGGGIPLVLTVHGSDIRIAEGGSSAARRLARRALASAQRVIAVSGALRAEVVGGFGVPPARVDVVPMGVDTRVFAPSDRTLARQRLGVRQDAALVLFVGALIPVKGVEDLVAAIPALRPGDRAVAVAIAGEGPLERTLRDAVRDSGQASRVSFLGAVPHERVVDWMNAADVLVLPSRSEGLPVCLMEAAAVGLPMVATDVGGSSEVVALDPDNLLVPPGDVPGLARALDSALGLSRPSIRRPMVEPGSAYSLTGSAVRVEAIYREAAAAVRV